MMEYALISAKQYLDWIKTNENKNTIENALYWVTMERYSVDSKENILLSLFIKSYADEYLCTIEPN